jgi:hypothetical protein
MMNNNLRIHHDIQMKIIYYASSRCVECDPAPKNWDASRNRGFWHEETMAGGVFAINRRITWNSNVPSILIDF